jgi:hypothetical protein
MGELLQEIGKIPWSTIVPWVISLLTIGSTVWVATRQMNAARLQPFRQKQFELYIEATAAAGRLASETDGEEWEKARTNFWRLYWGPLCIVEDSRVETAMVRLGELIPQEPIPVVPERRKLMIKIKPLALELAHAARGETEFRIMAGFTRS